MTWPGALNSTLELSWSFGGADVSTRVKFVTQEVRLLKGKTKEMKQDVVSVKFNTAVRALNSTPQGR